MIRYDPFFHAWLSGANPDDQGMPTTNLTGDTERCRCEVCESAFTQALGTNYNELVSR
jgi:hypothetical protein